MKSYEAKPGDGPSGEMSLASPQDVHGESPTEIVETEKEVSLAEEPAVDNPGRVGVEHTTAVSEALPFDGLPQHRRFRWPTRQQVSAWMPFLAVFLLGAVLRFWNLGDKPLHHDESLHAYFALNLLRDLHSYHYDPLLHGPFQFHAIALVYQISRWLGAADNGVNTTTVRIAAATLGSVIVFLPYFLRDYMGKLGAWLACLLLAVSPSMVYFSRFAREDIYMACFTLLLVVAMARYVRERKMRWLVLASAAFTLSYATKEATFLTVAIFGSFLFALIAWEIGAKFPLRLQMADRETSPFVPRTFAPLVLLAFFIVVGIAAKFLFAELHSLSIYITDPKNTLASDNFMTSLKMRTVQLVPWLGILLGLFVFSILAREMYGKLPLPGRRGLARFVDRRQPVLDSILTMPWTHWFFALIAGWAIFLLLFTVVFTNIPNGIGDGIWQGLYYWLQQQQVARGGQPWYYYLLLIPLYEQVGLVFGLVGIVYSLLKPTRFRLFLVYWFLGNVFIYSWAAEKMPWLMIHMTMPMMLLAAVGLEPCVMACYRFVRERFFSGAVQSVPVATSEQPVPVRESWTRPRVGVGRAALGLFGAVMAALLLVPTIHNMYEVTYLHPADAPHEMMVYVQTTYDVNKVMAQVDAVDQKDFGGKHQMRIAVTGDATWPFAWYLRDYPNLCFGFPENCASWKDNVPVIISGGDNPYEAITTYAPANGHYLAHEYHMRSWWDEGYKLPPCDPGQTASNTCADPNLGSGIGPSLWLSYGDNPPANAKFNLGLAAQHIWNWWWSRQAIGSTNGAYDMVLFIQKGQGINP